MNNRIFRLNANGNIEGVIAIGDVPNSNGNTYPLSVLEKIKTHLNDKKNYVPISVKNYKISLRDIAGEVIGATINENKELMITVRPILSLNTGKTLFEMARAKMFGFNMACVGSVKEGIIQDDCVFDHVLPMPIEKFKPTKENK